MKVISVGAAPEPFAACAAEQGPVSCFFRTGRTESATLIASSTGIGVVCDRRGEDDHEACLTAGQVEGWPTACSGLQSSFASAATLVAGLSTSTGDTWTTMFWGF